MVKQMLVIYSVIIILAVFSLMLSNMFWVISLQHIMLACYIFLDVCLFATCIMLVVRFIQLAADKEGGFGCIRR